MFHDDASAGGAAKTVGHRMREPAVSEKQMAPRPWRPAEGLCAQPVRAGGGVRSQRRAARGVVARTLLVPINVREAQSDSGERGV